MPVISTKIEFYTTIYDVTLTTIKLDSEGKPFDPYTEEDGSLPYATGVALGNGIFLTAAHSFDRLQISERNPSDVGRFKTSKIFINQVESTNWSYLRKWDPFETANPNFNFNTHPLNDVAIARVNAPVTDASITPFIIFSDKETQNKWLSGKTLTMYGQTTKISSGTYIDSLVEGQFTTSINTQPGDSGAPATISVENGTDYIAGILSLQPKNGPSTFSSLKMTEFFNALSQAGAGPTNTYNDSQPDLIISQSGSSEKYYRGTKKKANFIFDDNKSAILLGSNTDIVNTGSGTDNIIFLQDALGQSDAGATIIVSPGNDVVVGGSSNDKIFILADRLWSPGNGKPQTSNLKSNSDTIQILGGMISKADNDGKKAGIYSPIWNPNQSYDKNGYYHIQYLLEPGGKGNDLIIKVYAIDGGSEQAPDPHFGTQYSKNIWTSSIRIKDFKDGDFGIKFVEGFLSDSYKEAWSQVEQDIPSSSTLPKPSKLNNNDTYDDWNGVSTEHKTEPYDPGQDQIDSQLKRILDIYKVSTDPVVTGSTNRAPIANPDEIAIGSNGRQMFDLLSNDADPDPGDQLSLSSISVVSVVGVPEATNHLINYNFTIENNKLVFQPDAKFERIEIGQQAVINLNYVVKDKAGAQSTGHLTLTVTGENTPPIHGTENEDTLYGSARDDIIHGHGGNDFISAWEGSDKIYGDSGDDRMFSQEGDDVLEGGDGNDILDGGSGNDVIDGGKGDDRLEGGIGDDVMRGGEGNDIYDVDSLFDSIVEVADGSINAVNTDIKRYKLTQDINNLTYTGNDDFDGFGNDIGNVITGGSKSDWLTGEGGNDVLYGLSGNDVFFGGGGQDRHEGGAGFDTVDYVNSSVSIVVDLIDTNNSTGDAAGDSFYDIEQHGLTKYSDSFFGSNDTDYVYAQAGDDILRGAGGDDWLAGGAGSDTLDGGAGFDTADYTGAAQFIVVDRITPANSAGDASGDFFISIERFHLSSFNDSFVGSSDNEHIYGNNGDDILDGREGNDWIIGGAGADSINGGTGYDYASYFKSSAPVILDIINHQKNEGEAKGDTFENIEAFQLTESYDDIFLGSDVAEKVFGGGGRDVIKGGGGADFLDGESGNDTLTGGDGADTFAFYESSFGHDSIEDFTDSDKIEFSRSAFVDFEAIKPLMVQSGSDTVITLDSDNTVTIQNFFMENLSSSSFYFT